MGLGSGFGLRMHVAYITIRIDLAYKLHDPNQPKGERWVFDKIKPFKTNLQLLDWLSFLKKHMKKNVIVLALLNSVFLFSQERNLRNIQQLTDGGDNAKAYFSPNGKFLTMQVTNKIWVQNVN